MAQKWEENLKDFEKGEAAYAKAKQDATSRLEEIKERIKEIHKKTTASQQENLDMDYEVETEAEIAASTSQIKKMKEAMQGAVTMMKSTATNFSPKLKKSHKKQSQSLTRPNCSVFGMEGLAEMEAHETSSSLGGWWCYSEKIPIAERCPFLARSFFTQS